MVSSKYMNRLSAHFGGTLWPKLPGEFIDFLSAAQVEIQSELIETENDLIIAALFCLSRTTCWRRVSTQLGLMAGCCM